MTMAAMFVGLGGMAVGSMMMKGPKIPKVPKPTPGPTEMDVSYAGEAERQRRRRRRGYTSTILTGGELGAAATERKQILG